jgi:hypothetical protein
MAPLRCTRLIIDVERTGHKIKWGIREFVLHLSRVLHWGETAAVVSGSLADPANARTDISVKPAPYCPYPG